MTTVNPNDPQTAAVIASAEAVAAVAAPLVGGAYGALADQLLVQGLQFWAAYAAKKAAGALTMTDLEAAAVQTNTDYNKLLEDIKATGTTTGLAPGVAP